MYNFLRRIHLYTGLIVLLFVLMYFVSGYVLIHGSWFNSSDTKEPVMQATIERSPIGQDPDSYSQYLQEKLNLPGQRRFPTSMPSKGPWKFSFNRPGVRQDVRILDNGHDLTITRTVSGWRGLLLAMHRQHGYERGNWPYKAWAVILDIVSASMILFALSGIYLWYKQTKTRWPGYLCLLASFGFAAAIILYQMYRP